MTDTDPPDRRRRFSLQTSRMEAFSDGIFAIASTLLVLDLAIPGVRSDVGHKLVEQWPTYLAYVVSFATIGNAWLNHSVITEYLERADAILLRLNLVLLFFVSVLPFPTHMLAEYLGRDRHRAPVAHGGGGALPGHRAVRDNPLPGRLPAAPPGPARQRPWPQPPGLSPWPGRWVPIRSAA